MNPMEADHEEENVERLLRGAEAAPKMSDEARTRVLDRLLAAQAERTAPVAKRGLVARIAPRLRGRNAAAIAGVLALAAGAALLFRAPPTDRQELTYENEGPGPRRVALRDGSVVVLDAGATVVERAPRDVKLVKGQAIFDVKTQGAKFEVETDQGRAAALGTRFLVRASEGDATIAVAKGRVEIANHRGDTQLVRAGEQGVLRGAAAPAAEPARRVSHLFSFSRAAEPPALDGVPRRKGTLVARDPRWSTEEPLDLRSFDVDVHVEDGFAATTIDQTYFNPRMRQLEGTYAFPVPQGAAISRLAMYVDGNLMEGAIVERNRGRDIYEGIVEARRDPALLEWMSGNTFRMRVFPLPARTEKRIFMSYTQPLEHLYGVDRLTVPIPTVDQAADSARFRVRIAGGASMDIASPSHEITMRDDGKDRIVTFDAKSYGLGQDLVLTLRSEDGGADQARTYEQGTDRYVLVRHEPDIRDAITSGGHAEAALARRGPRRIAVLFDVSASRSAEDLAAQTRFVEGLVDSFDDEDEVAFVTVGYDAESMPGGAVAAKKLDPAKVDAFLGSRAEGIGSTRLDLGLQTALAALEGCEGERVVIYVGDGVYGGAQASGASGRASDLAALVKGKARFLGVGIGDSIDRGLLDTIAEETDGVAITVGEDEDLAHRAFDLVASTYTPCIHGLEAQVVDAGGKPIPSAVAVPTARHACDGERVEVVARAPKSAADARAIRVTGHIGDTHWEKEIALSSAGSGAAYLPRVFAERRVATLLAGEPPGPGRAESPNAAEITDLAKRYFLVTPFTSLLVLENDAMYKEYGVEKKKPEGWALYSAPEHIEVKFEPIGKKSDSLSGWDLLDRSPTTLFSSYDMDVPRPGFLSPADPGTGRRVRMGGISSFGLTGIGFGGGGRGQGFGSGNGRLGGAHSPYERPLRRVTSDNLKQDLVSLKRTVSFARPTLAEPMFAAAVGDVASTRNVVGGESAKKGWLGQAFRGASLDGWNGYENELEDLTELAPSMFTMEIDPISDFLAAARSTEPVDEKAKQMLEAARVASPESLVAERDGAVVTLRSGGLDVVRTLPTKQREVAVLDGDGLRFDYDELGLSTKRNIAAAEAWWLASELPFIAPSAESLRGLTVEVVPPKSDGRSGLVIRAPKGASGELALPNIEYVFDDKGRIASVSLVRGSTRDETVIRYEADRLEVIRPGDPPIVYRAAKSAPLTRATDLVEVALPLSNPARWAEIVEPKPGTTSDRDEMIRAHRQLLATYAALYDQGKLAHHLTKLREVAGKVTRGDVALASMAFGSYKDLRSVLDDLPPEDAVRAFASASAGPPHALGKALSKIADDHAGSSLGLMASYRSIVLDAQTEGRKRSVVTKIKKLHDQYPEARTFRYAAVRFAVDRNGWSDDEYALTLWNTLEKDPLLAPVADRAASNLLLRMPGKNREAADRAVRAFEGAIAQKIPVVVDWGMHSAIVRGRGAVAMDVLVARWRSAVLSKGTAREVIELLKTTLNGYGPIQDRGSDLTAVVRRLDSAPDTDEDARVVVAAYLLTAGKVPEAKLAIAPLMTEEVLSPSVLELSAAIAEEEGDLERAATSLDRLLSATQQEALDLSVVRGWYTRLIGLHMRRAGLATGQAADTAVAQMLNVAARFRKEDPGNIAIDELVATSLYQLGRMDEAKKHLSSIVERRPADGTAWSRVANVLETQGDLDGSLGAWREATRVEPTNPTWMLSLAQALLARGDEQSRTEALDLLVRIDKGKWQDRFSGISYQAHELYLAEK